MAKEETNKLEETKMKSIDELKEEFDPSQFTFAKASKKLIEKEANDRNKEAMKLVRVMITCNNSNKQNYQGEIFCVRNKFIPEVKKFVPFNKPFHVPQILLNMIKEKKYQKFKEERLEDGNKIMKPYLIDEYNISILPPLTDAEYEAIRQHQLAEGKVGQSNG